MADIRSDVGIKKLRVFLRDLRFVDSNTGFAGVDDAPFSLFGNDIFDFVGVDEAGFHDVVNACLEILTVSEADDGLVLRKRRPRRTDAFRVGGDFDLFDRLERTGFKFSQKY